MSNNNFHIPSILSLKLYLIIAAILMMFISSCTETKFLEYPESHRLLNEIEKWPDTYYWNIETGVFSRIFENQTEEEAKLLLTDVVKDWDKIKDLNTTKELINYFQGNNLKPIANAINSTLTSNADHEPSGEWHPWLQAKAIKVGLINAYNEVMKDTTE